MMTSKSYSIHPFVSKEGTNRQINTGMFSASVGFRKAACNNSIYTYWPFFNIAVCVLKDFTRSSKKRKKRINTHTHTKKGGTKELV